MEVTDAGQISFPTRFPRDESLSGQNLLQELQVVQAKDLDVEGDLRFDSALDCSDEDAASSQDTAFDDIWNASSMGAHKEAIDEGRRIVERRNTPFNGYVDSKDQPPVFSFNTMGPREYMGLDYRPASVYSDSPHAHASLGEQDFPVNAETLSFTNL